MRTCVVVLRRTWAVIVFTLASLLSLSLLLHTLRAHHTSLPTPFPQRQEYSYVPLNNISGTDPPAAGGDSKWGTGRFRPDDSDSQD